jgi:hypothetical protein
LKSVERLIEGAAGPGTAAQSDPKMALAPESELEKLVLAPAEQRRDEQAGEVEVV